MTRDNLVEDYYYSLICGLVFYNIDLWVRQDIGKFSWCLLTCFWFQSPIWTLWRKKCLFLLSVLGSVNLKMEIDQEIGFCRSELWNWNQTWYPEPGQPPDFTSCFHQTVLVYVPSAILWIFSLLEGKKASRSNAGPIQWNLNQMLRLLFLAILIITATIDLGFTAKEFMSISTTFLVSTSDLIAPLVKGTTFMLAGFLLFLFRRSGIKISQPVWFFWMATVICQGITFGSTVNNPEFQLPYKGAYYTTIISFASILGSFIINCFSDSEPVYLDMNG